MKDNYLLPLSPGQLMARAREITDINLIDDDVVEPLAILHRSYNEDALLSEQGALFVRDHLLRLLCNRLCMQRDFKAHPEIHEQEIERPIVICGMARSGSTKMQKLLASSGDFNWLPFWQSLNPSSCTGVPNESPTPRIRDSDEFVARWNAASPECQFMHEFSTHEPDEEYFLMAHTLRIAPVGVTQVSGYMQWLMSIDSMSCQLRFLRDTLKYLQWQGLASDVKRWILKAPHYYGHEIKLREVFPDASFIATHRHPRETLPSLCSFLVATTKVVSDAAMGDCSLFAGGAACQINQQMANRSAQPALKMIDVSYKELRDAAATVAQQVYAFSDELLKPESRQRMVDWDRSHPIHAKGGHKYALADFGFTDDQIDRDFAPYLKFMEERFS